MPKRREGWEEELEQRVSFLQKQNNSLKEIVSVQKQQLSVAKEAAKRAGVEVGGLKNVDDGSAVAVPPGCSYSLHTMAAMFNTNAAGGDAAGSYRLACRGTAPPEEVP